MQKSFRMITGLFMIFVSPGLFALGLGNAEVRSYIGQTLDARIQLFSGSQEELSSVTAGLASASAMEVIGITSTVSIPLRFEVHADLDNPYIQISSRLPVSEPVIQFVLEASWSGGRMLKEYTFFLDPATFASRAPAPLVSRRADPEPQTAQTAVPEVYPLPEQANVVQPALPEPSAEAVQSARQVVPDESVRGASVGVQPAQSPPVADGAPVGREPRQTATVPEETEEHLAATNPDADETSSSVPAVEDFPAEAEMNSVSKLDSTQDKPAEVVGPVKNGQTLWGIASTYAQSTPYSVNQAMLAIQRLNPDAFGGSNINMLKRGAILRMPADTEMGRVSVRQAMIESMRQEAAFKADKAGLPFDSETPAFANDTLAANEPEEESRNVNADQAVPEVAAIQPQEQLLQLIPPSDAKDPGETGAGSASQPTGAVASEDLQEVLARTEEELANAQQENAYLNERIRELEARANSPETEGSVTEGNLAELESRLTDERLSAENEDKPAVGKPADEQRWYSDKTWWLAGIFLLVIAAVVWLLKRLGGAGVDGPAVSPVPGSDRNSVKTIRSDAEDILKSLDNGESGDGNADGKDNVISLESYGEPPPRTGEPVVTPAPEPVNTVLATPKAIPVEDEQAIELDGDDPETMLDLARAYISMADPESARKILEEVMDVGNESQVAEAKGMMLEL